MSIPKWDDPKLKAGTMIRTALWLMSEIGVGNTFTKEMHRQAFSGVAQADRRLRDLREYGWTIHTSLEDLTLNSNEQRFVAAGAAVWQRGARKQSSKTTVTAKIRMATFTENNYQCTICGIAAGESYLDHPGANAVLSVARRTTTLPSGQSTIVFTCECKRCSSGESGAPIDLPKLMANIESLDSAERALFIRWVARGSRGALEDAWSKFRILPETAKDSIRKQLDTQ